MFNFLFIFGLLEMNEIITNHSMRVYNLKFNKENFNKAELNYMFSIQLIINDTYFIKLFWWWLHISKLINWRIAI